jgi:hypothetical protein
VNERQTERIIELESERKQLAIAKKLTAINENLSDILQTPRGLPERPEAFPTSNVCLNVSTKVPMPERTCWGL